MKVSSEPVFLWFFVLERPPLGSEFLRDCLEPPPKKRVVALSCCRAGSEIYYLGISLLNRLERYKLLPLICLEVQMAYIVGSQLLI